MKRIASYRLFLALTTLAFVVLAAPALVSVAGAGEGPAREGALPIERLTCEGEGERIGGAGDDTPPQYLLAATASAFAPDASATSTALPPGGEFLLLERPWSRLPARAPPA